METRECGKIIALVKGLWAFCSYLCLLFTVEVLRWFTVGLTINRKTMTYAFLVMNN